jgi:hypothetical protein
MNTGTVALLAVGGLMWIAAGFLGTYLFTIKGYLIDSIRNPFRSLSDFLVTLATVPVTLLGPLTLMFAFMIPLRSAAEQESD